MFSHGIPAAILFVGWFLLAFWRGRQARSMVGVWSNVAVFGALLIIFYYGLLASQIHILMVALAVGLREVATLETTKAPGASEGISPTGLREGA